MATRGAGKIKIYDAPSARRFQFGEIVVVGRWNQMQAKEYFWEGFKSGGRIMWDEIGSWKD